MPVPNKEYLHYLTDKDRKPYYVSATGSIEKAVQVDGGMDLSLPDHPAGWQDIEISFATNIQYFSLNRSFTIPLTYVNEGAKILRYLRYMGKGFEEEVYTLIIKWDAESGIYREEYFGKLDMLLDEDDPAKGVTVSSKEGGLHSYLAANDGVVYELDCDEVNVLFDGVELFDKLNYTIPDFEIGFGGFITVFTIYKNNEGDSIGVIHADQTYEDIAGDVDAYKSESGNYLFMSVQDMTVNVKGSIKVTNVSGSGANQFSASFSTSELQENIIIPLTTIPVGTTQEFTYNFNVDLVAEEKLFLLFANPGFSEVVKFSETDFAISFKSINPPSTAWHITPLTAMQRLVSKMSEGRYTADSNWFRTHNNLMLTSGPALRELENPKLKTSFKDFFDDYDTDYCMGIKIVDNVLWMEPKTILYDDTAEVFDIGETSNLKITRPDELVYNSAKYGSPIQDYNERNGKYEFNDTVEFKLPVTAKKAELNKIGKYRRDGYGEEFIRGKLNNRDSTDDKSDNEVFKNNVDTTTGTASRVSVTAVKESQAAISSGNIAFNSSSYTGTGNEYITNNLTSFTYVKADPLTFLILGNIYGSATGAGTITFTLNLNGSPIATETVIAPAGFFRADFYASQTLALNDVVTVAVSTGGATVNISSAGISFTNDTIVVAPTYRLKRVVYDTLTGIPTPNTNGPGAAFNIEEVSPKSQLLAWMAFWNSILYQQNGDKITFQTADKNRELSTTLNGVTIDEDADVIIGTGAAPFFLPFNFTFDCLTPLRFSQLLRSATGHIAFKYNGFQLYGLPIGELKARPVSNEAQEWKILASTKNNINTLSLLSTENLVAQDGVKNQLMYSILNPVHLLYYGKELEPKYHFKDMYDDWVHHRNTQYAVQPQYTQKWQIGDIVPFQIITQNVGLLELYVYDCDYNLIETVNFDSVADTAIHLPDVKKECFLDTTDYEEGIYIFVVKSGGTAIFISEWQNFAVDQPNTYIIEYYNTQNKQGAYFNTFKPSIRVEAMWEPDGTETTAFQYEDEPGDLQILSGKAYSKMKLHIGWPKGIPDWMERKLAHIFLLNRVTIEGTMYVKPVDSKLEASKRNGYPFASYTVDLRKATNTENLSITDIDAAGYEGRAIATIDAEAFGQGTGVIKVELNP